MDESALEGLSIGVIIAIFVVIGILVVGGLYAIASALRGVSMAISLHTAAMKDIEERRRRG